MEYLCPLHQNDAGEPVAQFVERLVQARQFRQPRGTLPSEKMRGAAAWTTTSQRDAMILLETRHEVAAYRAWPDPVTVMVGSRQFDYYPSLGFTLSNGHKFALDLVRPEDENTCPRQLFDLLLRQALSSLGVHLLCQSERALRHDHRLPSARAVLRAAGWPVSPADEFACLNILAGRGAPVTVGELRAGPRGHELAGIACVLSMRRVLALNICPSGLNACSVRLPEAS